MSNRPDNKGPPKWVTNDVPLSLGQTVSMMTKNIYNDK